MLTTSVHEHTRNQVHDRTKWKWEKKTRRHETAFYTGLEAVNWRVIHYQFSLLNLIIIKDGSRTRCVILFTEYQVLMAGNDAALAAEIDKRVNACDMNAMERCSWCNIVLKYRKDYNTIFLLTAKHGWYVTSMWDIFITVLNVYTCIIHLYLTDFIKQQILLCFGKVGICSFVFLWPQLLVILVKL